MTPLNRSVRRRGARYLFAALAAALPLLWLGYSLAGGAAAPAREARLREVILQSPHLSYSLSAWVGLPPGYDDWLHSRRRYPVVYLLHGSPGEPLDWFNQGRVMEVEDRLIAAHQIQPMILVAADGRGPGGDSQCTGWLNSGDGTLPMEEVLTQELVPEIDRRFRTIAAARARGLLGVSAGGYAAYNLGFRHPDEFGALAAHSGYFVAEDDDEVVQPMLGTDPRLLRENSPYDRAPVDAPRWSGRLYFDCGTHDDLMNESVKFHALLQRLGVAHTDALFSGDHSWDTWHDRFPDSLRFLQRTFQRLAPRRSHRSWLRWPYHRARAGADRA